MRDLVALARALSHRADRIAWLACLRAPWCGLGLEALLELVGDDPAATLWERMNDAARLGRLPAPERARLEATRTVLARSLEDRARRPLAECVEAAWLALGGPATLSEAADLENAASFLTELDRLEHAGDLEDPPALASKLTELYAAPDANADESLQLLTVHRAKGLEWDVVVLAGLGRRPRGAGDRLLHWLEFTREDGEPGLVLAPRRPGALPDDPLESWLKGLERARAELELGRLLYVAATRAKERLHLVGHVRARDRETGAGGAPDRGSLLAKLWPVVGAGADLRPPRAAAAPRAATARALRLPADWQAPPTPPGLVALRDPPRPEGPTEFEFEWVGAAARHVGTVVHEELERAGTTSLEALARSLTARRPVWRRRLIELGIAEEELARALGRIERALEFTRGDSRGQWLFDPTHTHVASELDLSTLRAGQVVTRRIDRSFVDATGVRWIVDFKTSVHEGTDVEAFLDRERVRYEPQLAGYADLLRRLDPGRPIRLGLYFPLLAGWREWAAPDGA
jgi:ATP-dependent exoDNAse (exonuclease V) beta subunit